MNILFVVAEMAPLAKVGGVGDVGAALPRALRRLQHDVRVALPYYQTIRKQQLDVSPLALSEGEGPGVRESGIREARVHDVPIYLVENEAAFGRENVYGYPDDTERFLAFADGLLSAAMYHPEPVEGSHPELVEPWLPDVIHLNDWHTGFVAARLATRPEHPWATVPRVFTIHNLGYAGTYDDAFAREHGLPEGSALVQGITNADYVTTVSPTYAREILTPEYGGELTPLLRGLGDRLVGILNGIDTEEFDPARDPHLTARYDTASIERRVENKRSLQERLGLPVDDEVPLIAMVNRLFVQKGSDLAADAIEELLPLRDFQFAVLGTGEKQYEEQLAALAQRHPDRVGVRLAFDAPFGQLFYGGCDMFLMPSRYEPCGLGQLISMRYGAIPIVRRTGGLADSVSQYEPEHNRGTGFLFDEPAPEALVAAIEQALSAYEDPPSWRALQLRAMAQDVSWDRAAQTYLELYGRATETVS